MHIRLPEDLHKELRVKCIYEEMSVQEFVEGLIKEKLAEYKINPEKPKKGH
ncbi:MAG: hypothetical protein ACK4WF_07405 [Candidatus Brocadiales bacterium]